MLSMFNLFCSRMMTRLLAVAQLFSAVCLLTAATAVAQKIDNGIVSIAWDDTQKNVTISQSQLETPFAKIEFLHGRTARTAITPGQPGGRLMIQSEHGVEVIFAVSERNPFVQIVNILNENMFRDGPIKKLEAPQIELLTPANDVVTLGTAGLRAVDGHKGSYMFLAAANPKNRSGVVTGWTTGKKGSGIIFSEKNAAGKAIFKPVLEYGKLMMPKDFQNAAETATETFVIGWFDDCRLGLERYADKVVEHNKIQIKAPRAGYCTWYADAGKGGACNEKDILILADAVVEKLVPFGFNFIQIDDKWQDGVHAEPRNGPKKNFLRVDPEGPYPNGMRAPADSIRSKGMMAGIWLLPFAGEPADPHWDHSLFAISAVTDQRTPEERRLRPFKIRAVTEGKPYESRWTGATVDMTNPAAQEYLYKTIEQMAKDWNYNYYKLDGFNAGLGIENIYDIRNGEYRPDDLGDVIFHNPEITPVGAHRIGLEIVRKAAGEDAFILGCNISQNMRSMGASYGLVDAMRIGPDNDARWTSLLRGPWHGSNRYFFNGRVWWNDPDPVYVKNSMPLEHAQAIATWVAVSGQFFVFSDWVPNLSEERLNILRRTLRPHGLTSVKPVDFFSEDLPKIWYLSSESMSDIVAFYNWDGENPTKIETTASWIGLPEAKEYVAFDYWGDKLFGIFGDKLSIEIPPTSCLVLAVQPVKSHPILLSTSQHVTQGIVDVVSVSWNAETKTLSGVSKVIANDPYELRIYDPATKAIRRVMFEPTETNDAFEWSVRF